MTSHMSRKSNTPIKNVKRAALIKYKLACHGLNIADIARDLGVSHTAASRSIYGLSKVSRVDEWLCEKLGKEVVGG